MPYQRRKIKVNDHEWSYIRLGKGSPLFLLHGILSYADFLLPLSKELSGEFEVIIPDLPGFGYTKRYRPNSYQNIAAGLNGFIRALGFEKINIFGSSMGGITALEFARGNREMVSNLIVHAAPWQKGDIKLTTSEKLLIHEFLYHAKMKDLKKFQELLSDSVLPVYGRLGTPDLRTLYKKYGPVIKESLELLDPKGTVEVIKSMEETDLGKHLKDLNLKTLIIASEHDDRFEIINELELAERVDANYFVIAKEESHVLPMSEPVKLGKIISSFINNEKFPVKDLLWGKLI